RGGYVPAERFGAAANLHAFDRGDDTDDHGHERRLDQAGKNAAQVDGGAQPVDECGGGNIRIEPRGHHASAKCGKICEDGEARQADDQRNQARKDQHADRVQADYLQRIDLLAHLHRADLSGNGTAGPAGNHDRGQKHAQFPQEQDADEIDDEYVGTEIPKLIGPLLRDDGPDDARHQHHDGYGPNAHAVDLVEDRGGIYGMPPPQFHLRAADGGPQYVHGSEEIVAHLVHLPPDRLEPTQHDVGLRWARRVLFSACRVAHGVQQDGGYLTCAPYADFRPLRPVHLGKPVDQPCTCGVHLLDIRKIEGQNFESVSLFKVAHLRVDVGDGPRGPDAGKGATQHAVLFGDGNARQIFVLRGGCPACLAFANGQHGVLFNLTETGCRFAGRRYRLRRRRKTWRVSFLSSRKAFL